MRPSVEIMPRWETRLRIGRNGCRWCGAGLCVESPGTAARDGALTPVPANRSNGRSRFMVRSVPLPIRRFERSNDWTSFVWLEFDDHPNAGLNHVGPTAAREPKLWRQAV